MLQILLACIILIYYAGYVRVLYLRLSMPWNSFVDLAMCLGCSGSLAMLWAALILNLETRPLESRMLWTF